jgi:hypothetical protein
MMIRLKKNTIASVIILTTDLKCLFLGPKSIIYADKISIVFFGAYFLAIASMMPTLSFL